MGKTPIYIFLDFGSRKKDFERKNRKTPRKNSKNLKVAGNYPNMKKPTIKTFTTPTTEDQK